MIVPIILRQVSRWSIHSTAVLLLQSVQLYVVCYYRQVRIANAPPDLAGVFAIQ